MFPSLSLPPQHTHGEGCDLQQQLGVLQQQQRDQVLRFLDGVAIADAEHAQQPHEARAPPLNMCVAHALEDGADLSVGEAGEHLHVAMWPCWWRDAPCECT